MLHFTFDDVPLWARLVLGGVVAASIAKDKAVRAAKSIGRKVKTAVKGKDHPQ